MLYSGAVGAGKSRSLCDKGYLLNLLFPGNRGLIVRKEFTALKATTLHTLLEEVIPKDHIIEHRLADHCIVHKTGIPGVYSEIWYFGLDKGASQDYPTKILSSQFGWIAVDETTELSEKDYQVLLTRLRYNIPTQPKEVNDLMPRQIFGATNPDGPNHWLFKRFFENQTEDREVILATAYDNHYLPPDYLTKLEQSLSGIAKERLLFGKWVQSEGIIYKDFDPQKHVIEEKDLMPINQYKYLIAGADSNFPLPRACVLIGVCGDGTRHVIDEFYHTNAYVEDLKKWLEEWKSKTKHNIRVYHDPSDPQAIQKLNSQGVIVLRANNDVVPGISTVDSFISKGQLLINKKCIGLLREISSYAWRKESEGKEPSKEFPDHAMDALRYALHSEKTLQYKPVIG